MASHISHLDADVTVLHSAVSVDSSHGSECVMAKVPTNGYQNDRLDVCVDSVMC